MAAPGKRRYGKLAKIGLVWGVLRLGGNSLILIPTSAVLARLLSPEDFGVAAVAYFFTQLAGRLTNVGFGASLVRLREVSREHLSSVFAVSLALGVTTWFALTSSAQMIGAFMGSPETAAVLPTAALGFIVMAFGVVPTALLSRDMRYRQSTSSDWLGTITNVGVSVSLAWHGYGFWSLVYGRLAEDVMRTATRLWIVRWIPRLAFSAEAMKEVLSFGLGVQAKNLLDYTAQNLDNVIVGRLLGVTALGFYDKAFSAVSKLLSNINVAGPSVSFRVFSLIHDDHERFRRAYRKVVTSVTLLGYPVLSGMIVSAPELIEVWLGPRWAPSVLPFQILCGAAMFKLLNMYASSATQAKGQVWSEVKRQAVHIILLVAFVATLCRWGIAGAALGVLLATAAMTVLFQILVQQLTQLRWRDLVWPQVPAIVCAAGLVCVLMATRAIVQGAFEHVPSWILLLTSIAVAALYYLAFLLLAPFAEMRGVVYETADDLVPAVAKRLTWLAPSNRALQSISGQRT